MSSPPFPVSMPPDDDDNDICPVCDRECTCHLRPVAAHVPQPKIPSLKIKLTVPQSMLANRRNAPIRAPECAIDDPGSSSTAETPPPQPRRRGRPPKPTRSHINRKSIFIKQKAPLARSRLTKDKQAATAAAAAISRKVAAAKKRGRARSQTADSHDTYDDDDPFPTFVSASALSSLSSDSDSSSSSDAFETDSEIEDEEEKFIIDQVRDKARVRRELLGDDGQARRNQNNDWVIRPRKKSVGPSDDEMDIDSDATADDNDDDDDDDEDEDGDNDDDDEADGRGVGAGYVGLATGWSEDDESSFDADLFFANLSGSDSSSTPTSGTEDDADQSDMDSVSAAVTDLLPHLRQGLENLPFEVSESWDGQIVFTNGLRDGQGVLDIDFEIDAAQFMVHSSPSSGDGESDVDMIHSDRGYEEDLDGGDGDTTDEELVGENDLPNERAMQLFSFPLSVSAINPLSTVSPSVSPGPRSLRPITALLSSPKPADILAGRVFWESDEPEDVEDTAQKGTGPLKGCFLPNSETRTAIIDDSHKSVPSPHPSFRRAKSRRFDSLHLRQQELTDMASSSPVADRSSPFVSSENNIGRDNTPYALSIALNDVLEPSFLDPDSDPAADRAEEPPCSSSAATSGVESDSKGLGFNRWDLVSLSAGAFRQTREAGTAITHPMTNTVTDYGKMIKASPFTAMREMLAGAPASSSSSVPWKNKKKRVSRMMDISPVILPRDGDRTPTPNSSSFLHPAHSNHPHQHHQAHHNQHQKSRKELRRERKLKRKSTGTAPHQQPHHRQSRQHHSPNSQHYQHHHAHRHYPNSKSRGLAAVQRTGSGSFVPPLSL